MRHKSLFLFALGILAAILVFVCFRMDLLFVEGAFEAFVIGLGIGFALGIILTVWIAHKVNVHEDSPKPKA